MNPIFEILQILRPWPARCPAPVHGPKIAEMLIKPVVFLIFWVPRGFPDSQDSHKKN